MNQSVDFRYCGTHAEEMTGAEHVSQPYHLNPAGSNTDYRHSGCSEVIDPRFCSSFISFDDGFHHALLSEYIDLRYNPTYVIIDSGCTRAMGSRTAIMRLVKVCKRHYNASKIDFSFEPSSNRFSFRTTSHPQGGSQQR